MVHTQQVLDTQSIGTVSMSIKYTYGVRAAADANQVHTDHAVLSHIEYTGLLPVLIIGTMVRIPAESAGIRRMMADDGINISVTKLLMTSYYLSTCPA